MVLFNGVKPQEEWEAVIRVSCAFLLQMYINVLFICIIRIVFLKKFISVTEAFPSQKILLYK